MGRLDEPQSRYKVCEFDGRIRLCQTIGQYLCGRRPNEVDLLIFNIAPNHVIFDGNVFGLPPSHRIKANLTEPVLSPCSRIGSSTSYPSSSRNILYHATWLPASARLIYLASVVLCAAVFCLHEHQEIAPSPNKNT
jgi:hypothetical protein